MISFYQKGTTLTKYKDDMKGKFTATTKNDTLYIDFSENYTTNASKIDHYKCLVVFYDTIKSINFKNSNVYIQANKLHTLKAKGAGASDFCLHGTQLDSLIYHTTDTNNTHFNYGEPSHIDHLIIKASGNSTTSLENVITKKDIITKSDNAFVNYKK
ncbi:hypothetical protein [Aquimarina agarivorans]|uniref:hypothetical protein n=1 Tax=Aquimarina agarivorans TaxID=980584 RepID=UPI0002FC02F4|nr:hypothetical protein [Aquimarina agarivorans]